jgi:hypothetical protein
MGRRYAIHRQRNPEQFGKWRSCFLVPFASFHAYYTQPELYLRCFNIRFQAPVEGNTDCIGQTYLSPRHRRASNSIVSDLVQILLIKLVVNCTLANLPFGDSFSTESAEIHTGAETALPLAILCQTGWQGGFRACSHVNFSYAIGAYLPALILKGWRIEYEEKIKFADCFMVPGRSVFCAESLSQSAVLTRLAGASTSFLSRSIWMQHCFCQTSNLKSILTYRVLLCFGWNFIWLFSEPNRIHIFRK